MTLSVVGLGPPRPQTQPPKAGPAQELHLVLCACEQVTPTGKRQRTSQAVSENDKQGSSHYPLSTTPDMRSDVSVAALTPAKTARARHPRLERCRWVAKSAVAPVSASRARHVAPAHSPSNTLTRIRHAPCPKIVHTTLSPQSSRPLPPLSPKPAASAKVGRISSADGGRRRTEVPRPPRRLSSLPT